MRRKKNAECRMQSAEYSEGYRQGVKDMAKRLKRYYRSFTGKTMSAAVEYAVGLVADELIEKENDYGGKEEKG